MKKSLNLVIFMIQNKSHYKFKKYLKFDHRGGFYNLVLSNARTKPKETF